MVGKYRLNKFCSAFESTWDGILKVSKHFGDSKENFVKNWEVGCVDRGGHRLHIGKCTGLAAGVFCLLIIGRNKFKVHGILS